MFSSGPSVKNPKSDEVHSSAYCKLSTSFLYKVLTALKQLQSSEEYYDGADTETIVKFMTKYHQMSGDILSQVENALQKATQSFLVSKGLQNVYTLVVPAAAIHVASPTSIPLKLKKVGQLFNYPGDSNMLNSTRKCSVRYGTRSTTNKRTKNQRSRSRSRTRSRSRSLSRSNSGSPLKKIRVKNKLSSSKRFEIDSCKPGTSKESSESDE